jgi:UDP-glucose 4-epimerase
VRRERCVIYGGGGFIGSHVAEELLKHNIRVCVFDKRNSSRRNVEHIADAIDFVEGDFMNPVDLRESLKGHDYAVHLVSTTIPATSNQNPFYDVESNLISTLHLLDACVEQKIRRTVFISSGGTVYGNPVKLPIREDHPTNPTCSYGIIKLAIEKYFGLYKQRGLDYLILRLANPFGERQNPHVGQGLIVSLLHDIKHKQRVEIWGDGTVVRDFFYIKDGAKAVIRALRYSGTHPVFNIASGKGVSVNRILAEFRKTLLLNFDVTYLPSRVFDVKTNVLDISLARKELNWSPETSLKGGLHRTWRHILDAE